MPRTLRAILSVTATRSCDSMPVPATNPCSSAFKCVTGTPDGFFTPLEAQPLINATKANAEILEVSFVISGFMDLLVKCVNTQKELKPGRVRHARRIGNL